MQPPQVKKSYKNDIRGQRFTQTTLPLDLAEAIAGQRRWSKGGITLLLLLICFVAIFLICFLGVSVGLMVVFTPTALNNPSLPGCHDPNPSRFTLLVMLLWGSVLLTQTLSRSVAFTLIPLPLALILYGGLVRLGIIPAPFGGLLSVAIPLLMIWGLSFLTHCLFRSGIAALDVLYSSARTAKGLLALTTLLGALLGALTQMTSPRSALDCQYGTIPLWAGGLAVGIGLTWSMGLAAIAGWNNHKRQVPWRSPDVFREWALAIGSFGGTSFENLNLSSINFQGSTLANTDLRGETLYHTCFQQASGLERARVDRRYLDLDHPNVQQLLTHACSRDRNFQNLRLQGAYLQNADMRGFDLTDASLIDADLHHADLREIRLVRAALVDASLQSTDLRQADLTDTNLTGADFTAADLRDGLLVRAQVARTNFTDADLTGICIEDWSVSSQTQFTNVRCDYIYRKFRNGQPGDRYPMGRNFEPGEFAALFQEPENELEIIFKGDFSYNALSLAFYKLQTQEPELQLKLNGIEQRGDLWVVKVISLNPTVELNLEQRLTAVHQASYDEQQLETSIKESLYRDYEETRQRLLESEQLVKQLAGVSQTQAEALKEFSKKSFGNSFFITGSTITNLTGSGNIEYTEAAHRVRDIITYGSDRQQVAPIVKQFVQQLKQQDVATTGATQVELMQQLIVSEAEADPEFRAYLLKESQSIIQTMAGTPLTRVIEGAIAQLHATNPPVIEV